MNETRFLKTVTFGGYDKADTDRYIKSLYKRISQLESELRTANFSLRQYRKGTEQEQIFNTALAEEREKLAEIQSDNKALSLQIDSLTAENKEKEQEIINLRYSMAELENNLADADIKLSSMSKKDDASVFGAVFASAKKSASEIIEDAKKKAQELENNSKKLAESIVEEANKTASEIVEEAEEYAEEMTAEVDSIQREQSANGMKSAIIEDVSELSDRISMLKQVFEELQDYGSKMIQKTEDIISETQNTLIKGNTPVIENQETIVQQEKTVNKQTDYSYEDIHQKNNFDEYEYDDSEDVPDFNELEEVDILDDDDDFNLSGLVRNNPFTKKSGINLKSLDKQAEEFMNSKKPSLAEISAQAEEFVNSAPKKQKSGGIDIATLMAQANALED
ncbi:MAG: hypothetical protein K2K02_11570 [Ruminococcus sp.]|nr:hypothetical protein [Ruminococcus sp.]